MLMVAIEISLAFDLQNYEEEKKHLIALHVLQSLYSVFADFAGSCFQQFSSLKYSLNSRRESASRKTLKVSKKKEEDINLALHTYKNNS